MDLHRPFRLVTPTVDGDVLSVLARADHAFTPPEVHGLMGERSESGVRKALERLAGQGIVDRIRIGQAHTYRLNADHLAYPHITALARMRDELIARTRDAVASWEVRSPFVALFGSAARGPMRADSDIDLFVARMEWVPFENGAWRAQVDRLEDQVTGWTGNDTRVFEMSDGEVREALAAGDARVLSDIRSQGIPILGRRSFFDDLAAGAR